MCFNLFRSLIWSSGQKLVKNKQKTADFVPQNTENSILVVVVCIFRYFHLYLQKSIKKIKKRKVAEPQGQALAKRTCRGANRTDIFRENARTGNAQQFSSNFSLNRPTLSTCLYSYRRLNDNKIISLTYLSDKE